MRVLLISMPFGALERQALGLSMLKACLTGPASPATSAISTSISRACWALTTTSGSRTRCPTPRSPATGASPNSSTARIPSREQAYIDEILRGEWRLSDTDIRRVLRVAIADRPVPGPLPGVDRVEPLRRRRVHLDVRAEHRVAGAGEARSRRTHPSLRIVFGGANWEGEMGVELHRQFRFVDFVCSGESELSFPALVESHQSRRQIRPSLLASSIAAAAYGGHRRRPAVRRPRRACRCPTSPTTSAISTRAASAPTSCRCCCSRRRAAAGGAPSRTAPSAA